MTFTTLTLSEGNCSVLLIIKNQPLLPLTVLEDFVMLRTINKILKTNAKNIKWDLPTCLFQFKLKLHDTFTAPTSFTFKVTKEGGLIHNS